MRRYGISRRLFVAATSIQALLYATVIGACVLGIAAAAADAVPLFGSDALAVASGTIDDRGDAARAAHASASSLLLLLVPVHVAAGVLAYVFAVPATKRA